MNKRLNNSAMNFVHDNSILSADEDISLITYRPIGIVHSPYKALGDCPRQPSLSGEVEGIVELFPEYVEGVEGIEHLSHILLVCHFHLSEGYSLMVEPHGSKRHGRGVFATRAPARPNAIGISVVRFIKIEGNKIHFMDVDLVDGTPVIDIKPYPIQCYPSNNW